MILTPGHLFMTNLAAISALYCPTSAFLFTKDTRLKSELISWRIEPNEAINSGPLPEEELTVQISDVDLVQIYHMNISESTQCEIFKDFTAQSSSSYYYHSELLYLSYLSQGPWQHQLAYLSAKFLS